MARRVMDGGFRRIKRAAAPIAPEPDPRLALVDLFAAGQSAPQGDADPDPQPDPADRALELLSVPLEQEPQEPAGATEQEPTDTAAPDAAEDAHEAPGPEDEPVEDPAPADEKDYDPIAAVLG